MPLKMIDKLITECKLINVQIQLLKKTGEITLIIYLEDVILLKIKDLIDFDYQSNDIIRMKVKYKYKNLKMFNDLKSLNIFDRKKKLERINVFS